LPRPLPDDPGRVLRLGGSPRDADTILRKIDVQTLTVTASASITGTVNYDVRDLDLLGTDTIVFLAVNSFGDLPSLLVVARTSLLP
jgi:hypothetical protein